MTSVLYDTSFEGLMTAIFEIYEYKITDPSIERPGGTRSCMGSLHQVQSDKVKAERVIKKLQDKLSVTAFTQLYRTFLSEIPGIENYIYRYIQYSLRSKKSVENDYSHPDVLMLQQTSRKVHREKHRMEAFVRFQLSGDGIYFANIQPDFNVLPLISKHFCDRYADQRWLIYDTRRKYGLYYDLYSVNEIQLEFAVDLMDKEAVALVMDEKEELYQRLWQQYFSSVNIEARKNMKLHVRHMPRRYWRFLTEKIPFSSKMTDDSV